MAALSDLYQNMGNSFVSGPKSHTDNAFEESKIEVPRDVRNSKGP